MAPNFEFARLSTPSTSSSSFTEDLKATSSSVFSVVEVVNKHKASNPTFSTELKELSSLAISNISSFIKTTKTFQLSSLGPTGLVTLDLLDRANLLSQIPIVFIDTLHHFAETYELIERVKLRYPAMNLHIYKPKGCETREEFTAKYGENLWERIPSKFGYYTKAEPRDRALAELGASAYINGRRKTQGNQRGALSFLDVDEEMQITRVQPLHDWSFEQVWTYLLEHHVPYNSLHDQGFKSVGDFMSSSAVGEGDDERSGRWKGSNQTECGLHLSPSELKKLGISTPSTPSPSSTSSSSSSSSSSSLPSPSSSPSSSSSSWENTQTLVAVGN